MLYLLLVVLTLTLLALFFYMKHSSTSEALPPPTQATAQPGVLAPETVRVDKRFARTSDKTGNGELRLVDWYGGYKVALRVGGIPRGGATAADCEVVSEGAIQGETFTARSVPGSTNPAMTVRFTDTTAEVISVDTSACADGIDLLGLYTLVQK